jgi:hypothetical protein
MGFHVMKTQFWFIGSSCSSSHMGLLLLAPLVLLLTEGCHSSPLAITSFLLLLLLFFHYYSSLFIAITYSFFFLAAIILLSLLLFSLYCYSSSHMVLFFALDEVIKLLII